MECRFCKTHLEHTVVDLGSSPPSNAYLEKSELLQPEVYYPLKVKVCHSCWLVQTLDFAEAKDLFDEKYAYFSSTSSSWLTHGQNFSDMIIDEIGLGKASFVLEVASNDGYLLQNFVEKEIPCLGVEPTLSTARIAEGKGIPVLKEFFSAELGSKIALTNKKADLVVGNNVYAHVPDILDFTLGLKNVLQENGVITLEFPYLINLLELNQFDTIYHEHYSYLSLGVVEEIFKEVGLRVWRVDHLSTHGGSIRVYGCHADDPRQTDESVQQLRIKEKSYRLNTLQPYEDLQQLSTKVKNTFLTFLLEAQSEGKSVVGFGAAAKGNTLLNFAGVKSDLISKVYDNARGKIGKCLPGSHIPVEDASKIFHSNPDYVVIFPWNIKTEILGYLSPLKKGGTRFVTFIPDIEIS